MNSSVSPSPVQHIQLRWNKLTKSRTIFPSGFWKALGQYAKQSWLQRHRPMYKSKPLNRTALGDPRLLLEHRTWHRTWPACSLAKRDTCWMDVNVKVKQSVCRINVRPQLLFWSSWPVSELPRLFPFLLLLLTSLLLLPYYCTPTIVTTTYYYHPTYYYILLPTTTTNTTTYYYILLLHTTTFYYIILHNTTTTTTTTTNSTT